MQHKTMHRIEDNKYYRLECPKLFLLYTRRAVCSVRYNKCKPRLVLQALAAYLLFCSILMASFFIASVT